MSVITTPIESNKNLKVVGHPLILDKLSRLRNKACPMGAFKQYLHDIAILMAPYVTENLSVTTQNIETPICAMDGTVLADSTPVIVPILRAALGMSSGLEAVLKDSPVGHVGVYRDEETKKPVEYLVKLPPLKNKKIILVDPMLATGNSAAYAVSLLLKAGAKEEDIVFMGLICAPEGVKRFNDEYPKITIYMVSLDERLNENAYIVPGLGDAGDRVFGTN
ncbi:MAG: uracil phosphoribosyltransferase [Alphaproteobacteria bacterium]|nr:uracil phosphoribosyltransferase [Alphaproteobacteria bacterium]